MAIDASAAAVPWYKEPTKDQWYAFVAAWLGWVLDAFDFTVFLLIMVPIAKEFNVPLTDVAIVFTLTLWMRLVGATAAGWMADRLGRKKPLMISIAWFSVCNFIAGFSPTFWFLLLFRTLLGIGMGAEWPAGAALAMEQWPTRSRGFMSGVLQGSWGLGFLLSSACYWLLFDSWGWRGMLWIGIAPGLAIVYVRFFVKEPEVWVENQRLQRVENRHVKMPLAAIFRRGIVGNLLNACWFQCAGFVTYYSINALFATHLQKDLGLSTALIATPLILANLFVFLASSSWGIVSDKIGRRWAMIIPAIVSLVITPIYLLTDNTFIIVAGFILQGLFAGGGMYGQIPAFLNERYPTEVRATASAFSYHVGAIAGGLVPPILTYFATDPSWNIGFAIPMLIGTMLGLVNFIVALALGPETKDTEMVPDLVIA
ncbi:MAG TPA: MFS transporter [Stellaceae bacterium]|jgi:SHS family lactate transporter-like MFS transporter|nr:MFS transporter [Stellaceae bacterium]